MNNLNMKIKIFASSPFSKEGSYKLFKSIKNNKIDEVKKILNASR